MSVSLHDVHQALVQLGKLRFGEMNIEEAVREIVHTTHAMFSVDGAGLMLVDADQHLRNMAASDERLAHLEDLQIRHQEGPCIDAFDAKELVGVEDLESDARWPAFREAAVARRVRAVLASPLPYNQDAVGVVAVVSEQRRPWTPEAELALLAFTDLAALLIASMMQGQQQSELTVQLQAALKSRQVIEQAKGVLTGRDGITPREAYVQLRARARNERRKLVTVCSEVVKNAASGPAERLHQARAGSALDVVSTPPQVLRLVVMSVLVAAASPGFRVRRPLSAVGHVYPSLPKGVRMIILGIILLIVGFLLKLAIVWTIGIVVLAVGLVLILLGAMGRGVGGRRHYW